jgi:hypothetical protein
MKSACVGAGRDRSGAMTGLEAGIGQQPANSGRWAL